MLELKRVGCRKPQAAVSYRVVCAIRLYSYTVQYCRPYSVGRYKLFTSRVVTAFHDGKPRAHLTDPTAPHAVSYVTALVLLTEFYSKHVVHITTRIRVHS